MEEKETVTQIQRLLNNKKDRDTDKERFALGTFVSETFFLCP